MSHVISCNSVDIGCFCSLFLFCCYLVVYIMSDATNVDNDNTNDMLV